MDAYRSGRLNPEQFLSYARKKEWWTGQERYGGTAYTYRTVLWAVDDLDARGLIEHDRAPPGRIGLQSALRASPALFGAVSAPLIAFAYDPIETIRLKDAYTAATGSRSASRMIDTICSSVNRD